ncbi:MAG TPA: spermidine/putrescine ABC transporter substrate-binding protein [Candidatus Limnocylindria bacterium]|nr:spermidine/putrescine ABC transporter substrate-binding protein [Candidatus Limnocylindria bacterium]
MTDQRNDQTQIERAIARALAQGRISRRRFLRQAGKGGLITASALSLPAILAACGINPGGSGSPGASAGSSLVGGTPSGKLVFANWPLYIDTTNDDVEVAEEAGQRESATLDAFTAETGIEVDYVEAIQDNQEFFGTIQPALAQGSDTGWDMIAPTDWMVGNMIRLGYLEEFDVAVSVPNFVANAADKYKNPSYDPNNRHSVPWQSGVTGIAYNPALTGREITGFGDLLDPAFEGQIGMFSEVRDSLSLALLHNGIQPKDATEDDVRAANDLLKEQQPLVRGYYGNEYAQELADGNLAVTMAWSGDVFQLQFDNPDLQFVVPEAGGILWIDNMCIPKGAQHPADALAFMDYVYRPEVAAQITEYVNYICPVPEAQEIIRQHAAEAETDEDREYLEAVAESPLVFPTEEMLANLHSYKVLSEEEERLWNELFQEVTLG